MGRDALIVGINTYRHLPTLRAAASDAEAIAQCLNQHGDFRVKRLPEVVQGAAAVVDKTTLVTQKQLKTALVSLFNPPGAQVPDTALFYFSGHGYFDSELQEGYLATSEVDLQNGGGFSLRSLRDLLNRSPVRQQLVWLDCCSAGAYLSQVNPGEGGGKSRCIIAAARDFEPAYEALGDSYSVLTQALLAGLAPSRSPSGRTTNLDLTQYVIQALAQEPQTPIYSNSGEPIALTRLSPSPDSPSPSPDSPSPSPDSPSPSPDPPSPSPDPISVVAGLFFAVAALCFVAVSVYKRMNPPLTIPSTFALPNETENGIEIRSKGRIVDTDYRISTDELVAGNEAGEIAVWEPGDKGRYALKKSRFIGSALSSLGVDKKDLRDFMFSSIGFSNKGTNLFAVVKQSPSRAWIYGAGESTTLCKLEDGDAVRHYVSINSRYVVLAPNDASNPRLYILNLPEDGSIKSSNLLCEAGLISIKSYSGVKAVEFDPKNDEQFVAAHNNGSIHIWKIVDGRAESIGEEVTKNGTSGATSINISPNGDKLAIGYADGTIELREYPSLELSQVIDRKGSGFRESDGYSVGTFVDFASDGEVLISAGKKYSKDNVSKNFHILLWNISDAVSTKLNNDCLIYESELNSIEVVNYPDNDKVKVVVSGKNTFRENEQYTYSLKMLDLEGLIDGIGCIAQ